MASWPSTRGLVEGAAFERGEEAMKHYAVEDWVQLATGRRHPELEREMRRHVAGGCGRCDEQMRRWRRPPDASAAPQRHGPGSRIPQSLPRDVPPPLPIRLVYDSAATPPSGGVRSADKDSRYLHYQAGSFIVDIQLEVDPDAAQVCLAGQILHLTDPLGVVSDLRVLLVQGNGETVAKTRTNDFGEFVLDFDAEKRLRLAIVVNDKRAIVLPSTGPRSKRGT